MNIDVYQGEPFRFKLINDSLHSSRNFRPRTLQLQNNTLKFCVSITIHEHFEKQLCFIEEGTYMPGILLKCERAPRGWGGGAIPWLMELSPLVL